MFLKNQGSFDLTVSIPQIKPVRTGARAARCNPKNVQTLPPGPLFCPLAEHPSYSVAAHAIADDQPANHAEGIRLQAPLDRNLNPPDDLRPYAGDKRDLTPVLFIESFHPVEHLLRIPSIAKLLREQRDRLRIPPLYPAHLHALVQADHVFRTPIRLQF